MSRNSIQRIINQSANNAAIATKELTNEVLMKRNGARKQSLPTATYSNRNNTDRHESSTKQVRNNFFDINQNVLIMSQQPHQFDEIRELAAED